MAHVLLPCDLPSWSDAIKLLQRLQDCPDGRQMALIMTSLLDLCCVSLDPEEAQTGAPRGSAETEPGLSELGRFVDYALSARERKRFLSDTLPCLAERAAQLKVLRPTDGFLYSLRREEGIYELERSFVASLLANAFFSTFPKRNAKTHPTLQDFRMIDFFRQLDKRIHQKKMKSFLRYFESLDTTSGKKVRFTRKVLSGPSLPGWLCSDRPLVPLILRFEGTVHQAEPHLYRACPCSSLIGGDALKTSASKEARLFFVFPELLVILSFVEALADEEALIAENAQGGTTPAGFCFLDPLNGDPSSLLQFEDRSLLRELNKALAAFLHDSAAGAGNSPRPVGGTPDGRTTASDRSRRGDSRPRSHSPEELPPMDLRRIISRTRLEAPQQQRKCSVEENPRKPLQKRMSSQTSSKASLRTASQGSLGQDDDYYTADEESDGGCSGLQRDATQETSFSRSDSAGFVLGGTGEDEEEEEPSLPSHERLEDFRKRIRKRTRRRKQSRRGSGSSSWSSSSDMGDISEEEEEESFFAPPTLHGMRSSHSEPSLLALQTQALPSKSPLSRAAETALVHHIGGRRSLLMVTSSNGHLKAYSYDGVNPNLPVPFRARFRRRRSEEAAPPLPDEAGSFCKWRASLGEASLEWPSLERGTSADTSEGHRRLPVAVEPWWGAGGVEPESGGPDQQLRTTILWLAASMAELQAIVLYTLGHAQLKEVDAVYGKVLSRDWTVGDLSCEVLRFCRNRLKGRGGECGVQDLFGQLMGREYRRSVGRDSLD